MIVCQRYLDWKQYREYRGSEKITAQSSVQSRRDFRRSDQSWKKEWDLQRRSGAHRIQSKSMERVASRR